MPLDGPCQQLPEHLAATMDAATYRPDGRFDSFSDFLIGEADDIAQHDTFPEVEGNLEESALDVLGEANRGQHLIG